MLQNIRDNTQGLIAKFIIGLIIIPFALFGIDSLVGGSGPAKVATVNDTDITVIELEQAMNLERRRLLNAMGENADPSILDEKFLRGPALERLILKTLMLDTAAEAKIGIADAAVDKSIVSMPEFQQGGSFSAQVYQNMLRSSGYTPAFFKQLLTEDMLVQQLNAGLSGSDFVTSPEMAQVAAMVGQTRSFRYLLIPKDKMLSEISISDEELDAYYQTNQERFLTEDQVRLAYIEVKQEDFFEPVSEDELLEAYQLEIADFQASDERKVSHILLEISDARDEAAAREMAKELADRLAGGENFEALAEELSDDPGSAANGGDLGYTSGDTFPEAFEEALASLELNQVSGPVVTDAGIHLIKATEIKSSQAPSFVQRRAAIEQALQAAAAESAFVNAVESLRDLVFNSEGLSGPAKELGLAVQRSDLLGKSSAQGVLANRQVLAAAFSSDVREEGNNSEVLELAADHFIVVNVLESREPAPKPLSAVKEDILAVLNMQKATELAMAEAERLIEKLNSGEAVDGLAKETGYEWQVELDVRRNAPQVQRDLLVSLFAMPEVEGGAVYRQAVDLSSGKVAVVQLDAVKEGRLDRFSNIEKQSLKSELQRVAVNSGMESVLLSLRSRADIEIR